MKRLFIVRHAKSSWDFPHLSDFERPLNGRGTRDLPDMASRFESTGYSVDQLVSSPAVRAFSTAKGFAAKLGFSKEEILQESQLYHAGVASLKTVISKAGNQHDSVMIFGHNPGLTYLINELCDLYLDNLPTCAVCGIEFEIDSWSQLNSTKGRKFYYDFPKSGRH